MHTRLRVATDPVAYALAQVRARGLAVEAWSADQLRGPDAVDRPTLYLVDPHVPAPQFCDELEDWLRLPIDVDELHRRGDRLLARAELVGAIPIEVDDDDILRVGHRFAILSPLEARLLRLLLGARGQLVTREDAVHAMWPDGPPADGRALDNRVKTLRIRIAALPIRVCTVRSRGLLVEWVAPEDPLGSVRAS